MSKPLVSVLVPTFNRRPFIRNVMYMFIYQKYQRNKRELIILDDGTDDLSEIFEKGIPDNIRYIRVNKKMALSDKRNYLNKEAKGDIIMWWDDDDYYSSSYINYVVDKFSKSNALLAGKTAIHTYFVNTGEIYKIGPFHENHCTNTSLCYKREYLKNHRYEDGKNSGEEKYFLENYKNPMIQLKNDFIHLSLSHNLNTYNRESQKDHNRKYTKTELKLENIVKDIRCQDFFKGIKPVLAKYKESFK